MSTAAQYDLIVIGGGPVGLSTAFHASQRGLKTLVLEKHGYFNDLGSSAGYSRQFRLQYDQQHMSELCLASLQYWQQIQALSDEPLIGDEGSLWFGQKGVKDAREGGIVEAEKTMDALNIPYERLADATAIQRKACFAGLPKEYYGFFQSNGGTINIKQTERSLFNAGLNSGCVTYREWENVQTITSLADDIVEVTTQHSAEEGITNTRYTSKKLAITTGAYINETVRSLGVSVPIIIWQMASAYFKKVDPVATTPSWFVFQQAENESDPRTATNSLLCGFPELEWANPGYIRVATNFPEDAIIYDPNDRQLAPSKQSLAVASSWVEQFMPGLEPTPYFTTTCLIALDDSRLKKGQKKAEFFLDYMPDSIPNNKNIVTYTAGWAGKFIPILGDMICQMLENDALTEFNFSVSYSTFSIPKSHFAIAWQTINI
ncbi:NAD(P)/FAD-dependent oxidoreductase [Pseudoalteromonas arctica]|uniref:FAD-dependent oxidoreductase n=1 Tax=Pseudoalteromonas arctica TaxID=394751 RepID=A0A7Y0DUC9_9GAMM|nr:FAD-dependent oxidoreductase [Pseudoalteromonas arctica]NMM41805.1 FAD-dependent oxidoreductase [Pseudoalteromonas arctica]